MAAVHPASHGSSHPSAPPLVQKAQAPTPHHEIKAAVTPQSAAQSSKKIDIKA